MRVAHRRRSCKAEQGVASPEAACDRTWEDNAQHPWSHDPKSSHCCLVQGRTKTKCWAGSKKRHDGAPRGVASGSSDAGLSPLRSESPRAVMHASGCRRSIRAPIGAPPAPRRGGEMKKRSDKEERKERRGQMKRNT